MRRGQGSTTLVPQRSATTGRRANYFGHHDQHPFCIVTVKSEYVMQSTGKATQLELNL